MDDDAGVRHPIRIGISSCLLGQAVRFDGGHERDSFLTETVGAFVERGRRVGGIRTAVTTRSR